VNGSEMATGVEHMVTADPCSEFVPSRSEERND